MIAVSIFSLAASVFITVTDDQDKNSEIRTLQDKLDSVQNNLVQIKKNGVDLNERIAPFIKIALSKYPYLSSDDALDSLKKDIILLERKATNLELSELERSKRESEISNLKRTPPAINGILMMDKKKNIYVGMQFSNKVPIKFTYKLTHSKGGRILSSTDNGPLTETYPPSDGKMFFFKDQFNFPEHIPKQELSQIRLDIYYESIYFLESGNANLKRQLTKEYIIDPIKDILIETR